jgi:hypothetical protein
MTDRFDEMARKIITPGPHNGHGTQKIAPIATALRELAAAEREAAAKIADDYHEWTYWGQYDNASAAEAAAGEIAAAIRLGRPLTADEISKLDTIGKTPLTGRKLREYQNGHKAGAADMRERAAVKARNGCLVPPDGGSPCAADRELCEDIERGIRSLPLTTPKET